MNRESKQKLINMKIYIGIMMFLFINSIATIIPIIVNRQYNEFYFVIFCMLELAVNIFLGAIFTLLITEQVLIHDNKYQLYYTLGFSKWYDKYALGMVLAIIGVKQYLLVSNKLQNNPSGIFMLCLMLFTIMSSVLNIKSNNKLYINDKQIYILKYNKAIKFDHILYLNQLGNMQAEILTNDDKYVINISEKVYQTLRLDIDRHKIKHEINIP